MFRPSAGSKTLALLVIAAMAWTLSVSARPESNPHGYAEHIKSSYANIFVAKILTARAVAADHGGDCYYKYKSEIVESVRGAYIKSKFEFSSELSLRVGKDYLVFFSKPDAELHRFGWEPQSNCETNLTGYLLLYTELHEIMQVWDGRTTRDAVQFDDVWADFGPGHEINNSPGLVDLKYVKEELSR
jgi:hypothetical protein